MRITWLIAAVSVLCGCSVYESDGRKFLEANAGTPPWVSAQADLIQCDHGLTTANWILLERHPLADVFALEGDTYQLRVVPTEDQSFNCSFQFTSAAEMYEKSAAAVDFTMIQLQSPPKPSSH